MPDIYLDVDTALSEVPVNIFPLTDDTDFKTRETAVAYNASGMDLVWNFVTSAGAFTQTAVTPTTAGTYDWTHQGDGMYTIEIPASAGASINNDTEGYGWFTGVATGVLPWRGPILGFRHSAINDSLCDTNTTGILAPSVAGRTLDVATGGEAGLDYDNINVSAGANSALGWIESGTLQSATASTAVLRSATSLVDDLILGATIYIRSGTGAGQSRYIYDWVSATDTASVSPDWTTTPDNTSVYAVIPTAPAPTHSSTIPSVNVSQISGDSVAADNCEAFFDGTGYAGTGNTIPTVTSVTTVNALANNSITAAATAADFLAEINAEVLDVLNTDTFAELGSIPGATTTLTNMIRLLYAMARNKSTMTATTFTLRNDADSGNIGTATVSDDGTTATKGELA